jgi:hypothetical protein
MFNFPSQKLGSSRKLKIEDFSIYKNNIMCAEATKVPWY